MTVAARRTALIAIALLLVGANYWWFTRETLEEPLEVVADMPTATACPQEWAEIPKLFERPLTFDASTGAWLDHDGKAVAIADRLATVEGKPWDQVYRNVRVRMSDDASFGDTLNAMRSLVRMGVCRADFADIEHDGWFWPDDPRRGQRFDGPLEFTSILDDEGRELSCWEGEASPSAEIDMSLELIPEARALDIAPPACIIPDLPAE